jgi:hypothetical protein
MVEGMPYRSLYGLGSEGSGCWKLGGERDGRDVSAKRCQTRSLTLPARFRRRRGVGIFYKSESTQRSLSGVRRRRVRLAYQAKNGDTAHANRLVT